MRYTTIVWASLSLFFVSLKLLYPQAVAAEGRQSLMGLRGIGVVVSATAVATQGVPAGQEVQTDVEHQLRKRGIKVLTREEVMREPGTPLLEVGITIHPLSQGKQGFLYQISVECVQTVLLKRDPRIETYARTWYAKRPFGITTDPNAVRQELVEIVDSFAKDYLAAAGRK